jgi:hypothetical protein
MNGSMRTGPGQSKARPVTTMNERNLKTIAPARDEAERERQ